MAITNTTIVLKHSGVPGNTPSSLANGEMALNFADGKLFYKNSVGSITFLSGGGGNSFTTMNVNNSLILATSSSDTLTVIPGNNITISTDTVNKKYTINAFTPAGSMIALSVDKKNYIATAAQTTFALTYTTPAVIVTVNGISIDPSEYTATNGTTVVLATPTNAGDIIDLTGFSQAAITTIQSGVDASQNVRLDWSNTSILATDGKMQSAYNAANAAGGGGSVQKTGDVMTGMLDIQSANISTDVTTGALQVDGGIGIRGNVYAGNVYVTNTFPSFSTTSGALQVSGGVGIAGNVYFGGTANLAAGTATVAPLHFEAGTNTTLAFAGNMEYDGTVFYATPAMDARGLIPTSFYRRRGTANTLANTTSPQSIVNVRNGGVQLVAGTIYEFEGMWRLSTPIGVSRSERVSIDGSATFNDILFRVERNAANGNNAPVVAWGNQKTTTYNMTTASAIATQSIYQIKGTCKVSGSGTMNIFQGFSAASAGTIMEGAWMKVTPVGATSGVDVTVGNWTT